jgi:hypothetical protein
VPAYNLQDVEMKSSCHGPDSRRAYCTAAITIGDKSAGEEEVDQFP